MKVKDYATLFLVCIAMALINYLTGYGFLLDENLFLLVQIMNSLMLPMGMTYYSFTKASMSGQRNFSIKGIAILVFYYLTYLLPTIVYGYFDFQTFTVKADGASKAIFAFILIIGTAVTIVSILLGQFALLKSPKAEKTNPHM